MKTEIKKIVQLAIFLLLFINHVYSQEKLQKSKYDILEYPNLSQEDKSALLKLIQNENKTFDNPLSHAEYLNLLITRYIALTHNNMTFSAFVDPIINAKDFYAYLKKVKDLGYVGIRVYPGLGIDNKLVLTICGALGDDMDDENLYKVLEANDYSSVNDALNSLPNGETKGLANHIRYIDSIFVFNSSQPKFEQSSPSMRISRYYTIENLERLLLQNIPELDLTHNPNFKNYKVKIESGVVPAGNLPDLYTRNPIDGNMIYHYGYTVMFQVLDQNYVSTIKIGLPYEKDNYKNRALEVGNPCPPRCGILHKD